MDKILAMLIASWRSARSYRLRFLISALSLVATVVPIYYVSGALQQFMADKIRVEGHQYFAFLVVGLATFSLLTAAVTALPSAVGTGIGNGTLETLLGTPIRMPELLAGLVAYDACWAFVRALLVVATAALFGAHFVWGRSLVALAIALLIVASYVPFGLIGTALVLSFRTTGPLPQAVLLVSGLFGGVYFPTRVIPTWIQHLADVVPLAYGLRALRGVLIDGASLSAVARDLALLTLMTVILLALSVGALAVAVRHVKRAGALAHQ